MQISFDHYGERSGERLFVLIHGMEHTAANLVQVRAAIHEAFPFDHIVSVNYPSSRWSNSNPLDIAKRCVAEVDAEVQRGGGYKEIILIGQSLGALIARKICLLAHGICSDFAVDLVDVPVNPAPRAWANQITRIVLLAGMGRGWRLHWRNRNAPRTRLIARGVQLGIARVFGRGRLVRAAHRGSPFIVNLRLDWLALINEDYPDQSPPQVVVQIAGLRDRIVHPGDHIDLQAGRNFKYFSIEGTSHRSMVRFDDPERGAERKRTLLYALQTAPNDFSGGIIPQVPVPDFTVTDVILLLHGIRDFGKWQEDLSTQLDAGAAARKREIATSISNYDYLPLLPFLFGYGRSNHMQRFMDRYAEMRSRYPKAVCSFVGHSNGTYLFASALRHYQASRFARVAFMGSIVQRNFPWLNQFAYRIDELRNYVASADAVVAIFPSLFEMIRLIPLLHAFPPNRDFGSAGHTGFTQVNNDFRNVTFIEGDHGAALQPQHRDALVSFLLGDVGLHRISPHTVQQQSRLVAVAYKACVLIWAAILAASASLLYVSIWANAKLGLTAPVLPIAVILLYLYLFFRF